MAMGCRASTTSRKNEVLILGMQCSLHFLARGFPHYIWFMDICVEGNAPYRSPDILNYCF